MCDLALAARVCRVWRCEEPPSLYKVFSSSCFAAAAAAADACSALPTPCCHTATGAQPTPVLARVGQPITTDVDPNRVADSLGQQPKGADSRSFVALKSSSGSSNRGSSSSWNTGLAAGPAAGAAVAGQPCSRHCQPGTILELSSSCRHTLDAAVRGVAERSDGSSSSTTSRNSSMTSATSSAFAVAYAHSSITNGNNSRGENCGGRSSSSGNSDAGCSSAGRVLVDASNVLKVVAAPASVFDALMAQVGLSVNSVQQLVQHLASCFTVVVLC